MNLNKSSWKYQTKVIVDELMDNNLGTGYTVDDLYPVLLDKAMDKRIKVITNNITPSKLRAFLQTNYCIVGQGTNRRGMCVNLWGK